MSKAWLSPIYKGHPLEPRLRLCAAKNRKSNMTDKSNNLQDLFLNSLRKSKTPVTVFLVKGVKLQGIVTWFDNFSILLRRDGQSQLVYKHGISTIMPSQSLDLEPFNELMDRTKLKKGVLQEVFLMAVRDSNDPVTMFLVNGVMLQGEVAAYDLFCILLEREGLTQLVYKHAISTVQPSEAINLADYTDSDEDSH
ncbi:RNA chaperone Hfq [Parasphingorhabdus sp.]|uniref:RNA chaperone Hfq n=1 Tax=Parasphingorhabdus sp. TaxID=2709688 RepID=UPI002F938EAE